MISSIIAFEPDLVFYLLSVQIILFVSIFSSASEIACLRTTKNISLVFASLLSIFWLVWGGYSVDAWNYLTMANRSYFRLEDEALFWLFLGFISRIVSDPWPLKLVSVLISGILCSAYYVYLRDKDDRYLAIAFILLLMTPGYFLLTGNAVRQGIAGSLGVLAIILFINEHYKKWLFLLVVGSLIHQFSLVVFLSVYVCKLVRKYLLWIWIASPFVGITAKPVAAWLGYDLGKIVRYADYSEGLFHWEKFFLSSAIAAIFLISIKVKPSNTIDFRHIVVFLYSISNIFVAFEVPFERSLLFVDLMIPLGFAVLIIGLQISRFFQLVSMCILCSLSVLLWSNISIVKTLGLHY